MELNKLFEKLILNTDDLNKFSKNNNCTVHSIKFDNYILSIEINLKNVEKYKLTLSYANDYNGWYIDNYLLDYLEYYYLLDKFQKKISYLHKIEIDNWLNKKKILERKFKLNELK